MGNNNWLYGLGGIPGLIGNSSIFKSDTPAPQKGLEGTGYRSVSTQDPMQQRIMELLGSGSIPGLQSSLGHLSQMASGGNEDFWKQLEAPAMRQFGQLQGQLASRFSGLGTGARRSSGFQNAMGGAATDLAERLQSQRLGFQNQAIQQLLGLSNSLLGRDTQAFIPQQKPFWQELLAAGAQGVGQGIGQLPALFL